MALDSGGDDFLAKPVDARSLFQLMAQHLSLEWIYEEDQAALRQLTEMVLPPSEILQTLLGLAQQGNLRALRQQIQQLTQAEERYVPFAEPILQLARQFKTEEIEDVLHRYLMEGSNHGE